MERTERIALLHGPLTRNRYGLGKDRLMRDGRTQASAMRKTG